MTLDIERLGKAKGALDVAANDYRDILGSLVADELAALSDMLPAILDRLKQADAMEEALGQIDRCVQYEHRQFERNGPEYTSETGSQYYGAEWHLNTLDQISDIARATLKGEDNAR